MYPPHHLGGYEVIWQGAMEHLREHGFRVRILTTQHRNPDVADGSEDPDVYRELDWYWRDHEWRRLGLAARFRLERANAAIFDRHLAQFKPDVVTWWPVGGMSLGLIERVRRRRIPALLFVLDPWFAYGPRHDLWLRASSRLRPLTALVERATGLPTRVDYATSGRWVFCSRAMRTETLAAGLVGADDTILTPGVERSFLEQPRETEPPPWRWRLLYVGRVVEQKGVLTAIEGLASLPAEATLTIVGDGDRGYRSTLERAAARLGIAERVTFVPARPRDELPAVYRAADVVVHPVGWSEPWGLVPLEAMALGRPVLATGRGGSGEYLVGEQNALLFAPGDAGALATAVRRLAGDSRLRARLTEAGLETASRHSADVFNQRVLELIEQTAGRCSS